jgi:hypothetical protein
MFFFEAINLFVVFHELFEGASFAHFHYDYDVVICFASVNEFYYVFKVRAILIRALLHKLNLILNHIMTIIFGDLL